MTYAFWVKKFKLHKKTEEEEMRDEINSIKSKLNKIEERERLERELGHLKSAYKYKKKK